MATESISVVVPVYNSQKSLPLLVEALIPVLTQLSPEFEILLVNDGSMDESWKAILDISRRYGRVRGIDLSRNYGQHNAILCGIRAARYDFIVTMDDDLQHPPEEIPKLLDKLRQGYDVVYGTPVREQHGLWRDISSVITKRALQGVMGIDARYVGAFRMFRTQLREAFAGYSNSFVHIDVLLSWSTTRFAAVTVRHEARSIGVSNYTARKLLVHTLNMTTGFSTTPLQVAILLGFAFTLFGVGILVYVVGRYLIEGTSVAGFPFLASTIAIFSGVQLFALGIMGEYLARIHSRTMEKPPYCIRHIDSPR